MFDPHLGPIQQNFSQLNPNRNNVDLSFCITSEPSKTLKVTFCYFHSVKNDKFANTSTTTE
jgi:hypothetical protein